MKGSRIWFASASRSPASAASLRSFRKRRTSRGRSMSASANLASSAQPDRTSRNGVPRASAPKTRTLSETPYQTRTLIEATLDAVAPPVEAPEHIDKQAREQNFDRVIIDAAPTGETIRLLTMPDTFRWYAGHLARYRSGVMKAIRPFAGRFLNAPVEILDALEKLDDATAELRQTLSDPEISSYRVVLQPEKMVMREAGRTSPLIRPWCPAGCRRGSTGRDYRRRARHRPCGARGGRARASCPCCGRTTSRSWPG